MKPIDSNTLTRMARIQLEVKGFWIWRQNQLRVPGRKFNGEPGCSDLIGMNLNGGKFLACEVKAGKDELSEDQKKFLRKVKTAGGIAIVAVEGKGGNVELLDVDDYLKK